MLPVAEAEITRSLPAVCEANVSVVVPDTVPAVAVIVYVPAIHP